MERSRLLLVIVAVLGIALSAYMLRAHFVEGTSFCNINETFNCDLVNRSVYAELFGIPVALLGVVNYLLVLGFTLGSAFLARRWGLDERLLRLFFLLYALFGFLYSLYLTAIEAFVLHAYCPLCLASALFSTAIFCVAVYWWRS